GGERRHGRGLLDRDSRHASPECADARLPAACDRLPARSPAPTPPCRYGRGHVARDVPGEALAAAPLLDRQGGKRLGDGRHRQLALRPARLTCPGRLRRATTTGPPTPPRPTPRGATP